MLCNYYYMLYYIFDMILIFAMLIPTNLFKFHPFILCLMLIFYVIIICLKMNYLVMNYWYSYILFLIMIGGVMILFMYFTSISSNEEFYLNLKYFFYYMVKLILILILFVFVNLYVYKSAMYLDNFEVINFMNSFIENNFILKNLYMKITMDMNIFLLMYLFLTMTCSILICVINKIPMRQLN